MSAVERIGNHERESAVAALRHHVGAGRITSAEYEERSVTAREARTWSDLDPLFTDLPAPGPAEIRADAQREEPRPLSSAPGSPAPGSSAPGSSTLERPAPANADHRPPIGEPAIPKPQRSGWVPEPYGYTITALAPFAAVILFFVTGDWYWFLGIPVVGILVYGPDGAHGHKKDRDRHGRRR